MKASDKKEEYLNFIQMIIQFNDPNSYEVDSQDLQELLIDLNIECTNILTISKNNFFVVMRGIEDVKLCFQKLNNFFIEKLQCRIEINLCVRDTESSLSKTASSYKSIFEVECPKLDCFDIRKRMFGIEGYNMERITTLCEKDFFEGSLVIEDIGILHEVRLECRLIR